MRKISFLLTKLGLLLSIFYLIINTIFDFDVFEKLIDLLQKMESYEIDEVILVILVLVPITAIDFIFYRSRKRKIEAERDIYKSMNYVAHHVFNNLLNQLHIIKMEAQSIDDFDKDAIDMFDSSIEEAKESLRKLSTVTNVDPDTIRDSVLP